AEGEGVWNEYVGGYSDWLRQRRKPVSDERATKQSRAAGSQPPKNEPSPSTREKARTKLSYKEQRQLEALPGEIEALEQEQRELAARMSEADYYKQGTQQIRKDQARAEEIERLLMEKLERWEWLESERSRLS